MAVVNRGDRNFHARGQKCLRWIGRGLGDVGHELVEDTATGILSFVCIEKAVKLSTGSRVFVGDQGTKPADTCAAMTAILYKSQINSKKGGIGVENHIS